MIAIRRVPSGLGLVCLKFDLFTEWGKANGAAYDWEGRDQNYSLGAIIVFFDAFPEPIYLSIGSLFLMVALVMKLFAVNLS